MAKSTRAKLHIVREPSGRHSRALKDDLKPCSPSEVKRLRDAAVMGMQREEWGWEIGRLYLAGKITTTEFEAGKRWRRLTERWRRASGHPAPDPRALAMFGEGWSQPPDPDSERGKEEARRAIALNKEMAESHAVLVTAGLLAEQAVRKTCERDIAPEGQIWLESLSYGLAKLAELWCLTEAPSAQNGRKIK